MDGCELEKTKCVRCMRYAVCKNKGNPELLCTEFVPNCEKNDGLLENMTLGLGVMFAAMEKGAKVVEVTKAGVVQFPDDLGNLFLLRIPIGKCPAGKLFFLSGSLLG